MKREGKVHGGFAKSIHLDKTTRTKEERKKEVQDLIRKNMRALKYLEDK